MNQVITAAPLIQASGLTKHYPGFSLAGVNVTVEPGQVVGFVGKNGSGKSTTIKALLGLISLDAGQASVLGYSPRDLANTASARAKEQVGVVFDTISLPGHLKIEEVGKLMARAYSTWDAAGFQQRLRAADLDPKKAVKDLSRGMGMKLQLACALSHNAKLLVLDEATAGLDPMAREELLDELLAFVADGQHSVLLSSHITSDLDRTADRVICIDNGSIMFDLPREDITDRAGIAHCTQAQAAELMACVEGARAAHHAYSVDVLVPNRRDVLEAFPEIPCDRATIDDYLRLTLKGASK